MNPRLLYIKLGEGSDWADECIEKGIIRIGFSDIPKALFLTENLDNIWCKYTELGFANRAADIFWTQLNSFFHSDKNTVWITFHQQKMWWCKTKPDYVIDKDNNKYKQVIGNWSDKDINGKILWEDNLSGALLKTKFYPSTLCVPDAEEYAWNKIFCLQSKEALQFEKDLAAFRKSTVLLIQKLTWQDFEVLIDLIFRNAGFQRLGVLGRTLKTIDLSLLHPLSNEKIFVQIKSASSLNTYKSWKAEVEVKNDDFIKYYFTVHSPKSDIENYEEPEPDKFILWREKEISEMVIRFGLIDWLIQKVG
ncbi:MAG: hypothetical protein WC868_00220 [Bacteroidales bacterium]